MSAQNFQTPTDTVVIGMGDTGLSCIEYFTARGIPVSIIDTRKEPPKLAEFKTQYPTVAVYTGGFPKEVLAKAKLVLLSPGIPKDHPDLMSTVSPKAEIIGDIELLARNITAPVISITGSNGKSTVTTLVGEMAKEAGCRVGIGGNIGVPALSLLSPETELYVLELSSFQLETTYSLHSKAATVLNLCPDHLDRYANLEEYKNAKLRIYEHCDQIIFNRDDPILPEKPNDSVQFLSFGLDKPEANQYGLIQSEELWLARGEERLLPTGECRIFGRHNMANALAALALGESVGLPLDKMLSAIKCFKGLAHRCEWVRELRGVQWFNDSKGTNVGATIAALQGLGSHIPGKWVLIAGGLGKNADFRPLVSPIQQYCRAVVLLGTSASELFELLHSTVPCFLVKDMEEAVQTASLQASPGDGVLLSPACASYDMFRHFEERGDVFKAMVRDLL